MILAKKNQEILVIQREIDDIPTRAELLQFERRFIELNELDAEKLLESRKYYALYNILCETYRFMQSEVDLLNSIIDGFPTAQQSKTGKSYMTQVSDILNGITENQIQIDTEYQIQINIKEKLVVKYNKLLEKQRKYFKAIKEFQEECYKMKN